MPDFDNRFVSLDGPRHHQDEDDDEFQERIKGQVTENKSSNDDSEPGAFAISRESRISSEMNRSFVSVKSSGSNGNLPFQVEAMLVPEGVDFLDPPDVESIRRQILDSAVEADAVDVNQIRKRRRCRIVVTLLVVIGLVVGLSVGLDLETGNKSIVITQQSPAPSVTASDSPSAAPTMFSIALCSPYVFVEDVELYLDGFDAVVQHLNEQGVNITVEELDICAPQSLSAFNIAIDRYNANIILNSQDGLEGNGIRVGGAGGPGGNNPNGGVPGDSTNTSSPPPNRRQLLSTLDTEVLLIRYALGVLFFSTGGEQWEHNANWLTGTNANYCVDWEGIHCEFGGSLLTIELSHNRLEGTIPTEIALFVDLGKCLFLISVVSLHRMPRASHHCHRFGSRREAAFEW
jgi:hypothetical protein